jgi:hypothetical protein
MKQTEQLSPFNRLSSFTPSLHYGSRGWHG